MLFEFKKKAERILYPTDLSENANCALLHAVRIANCYGAKITILYVLEDLPPNVLMIMQAFHGRDRWEKLQPSNRDEILQSIRDRIQAFCAEVASNLPECPFVAEEILVETGHAVERILYHLENKPCDMVVMGSRGQGVIKEALLGSTPPTGYCGDPRSQFWWFPCPGKKIGTHDKPERI
jgi:nucleotide-binding universal stress UspA family protein